MRLQLFIAILFLAFKNADAQLAIDEISNDDDAVRFVQRYSDTYKLEWKKVGVDIYSIFPKRFLTPEEILIVDSLTKRKWIKADFNQDGKTDLIFSGKIYSQLAVLAFLTRNDSVELKYIGSTVFSFYPTGIEELDVDNKSFLVVNCVERNQLKIDWKKDLKRDTLIYKFDGFVEYNSKPASKFKFDSVVFRIFSTWSGVIDIPVMKIFRDGNVTLQGNKSSYRYDSTLWVNGVYESKINVEMIKELEDLLGYINFPGLEDEYEIKLVSDLATVVTEVYYEGKMKKVKDYGYHGTFGLHLLYKFLNKIKTSCRTRKD
ncbi:MAG TPA: hypothetical protein VF476_11440 [Chitinophagaceae bacterium]